MNQPPFDETRTAETGFAAFQTQVQTFIESWRSQQRLRELSPSPGLTNPDILDLTHNDYMGLRNDPVFQERARKAMEGLPVGSGASRLLGGEHPLFEKLERRFSAFKQAPSSLYFGSGYGANEAVAVVCSKFGGRIFSDTLNHASMIDGIRLSSVPREQRVIYPHKDLDALEVELARSDAAYNLIFTESLFSMDGDVPDLPRLQDLARRFRGILVIDEAHAIGCLGPKGRGLVPAHDLDQEHLITVNTCGKAMGVQGALVCGPEWFRTYMINLARPFIFTTAPSPWLAAAVLTAIDYLEEQDERRQHLATSAQELKQHLKQLGYTLGHSTSHIIPLLCGSDAKAVAMADALTRKGIVVKAVRPPTVPEGTARVRLSLNAGLSNGDLARIAEAFEDLIKHDSI